MGSREPSETDRMNRFISLSLSLFIGVCLLFASQHAAWGYVDPGSGLLAMQSIASVLAAAGFFLRRQIRELFHRGEKAPAVEVRAKDGNPAKAA